MRSDVQDSRRLFRNNNIDMATATPTPTDPSTEEALASLFAFVGNQDRGAAAKSRHLLESKLDGAAGVIQALLPRVWQPTTPVQTPPSTTPAIQGDHALAIIIHCVEANPTAYMALTSNAVRRDVEKRFATKKSDDNENAADLQVTDALILALAKLLVGPNSETQVGIATNAQAALLTLCIWDHDVNIGKKFVAKRVLSTLETLWTHLQQQKKRELSAAQMRIAALMVNICVLGDKEMHFALSNEDGNTECIMDKLLNLALQHPNDDPLLQMSALDQLELLTAQPMHLKRAIFLLGNDLLRRGLMCLVGSEGSLTQDAKLDDKWGEMDPINGAASLRVLTEICRVGVSSTSMAIGEDTMSKFHELLQSFQRALHNFQPQGELERLSFIHAVSSLFASCSIVASSTNPSSALAMTTDILQDTNLLHEWLSLHSRVAQPKLKSAVLCSMAQVMEPTLWRGEQDKIRSISIDTSNSDVRPNDAIVIQLFHAFSTANNREDSTELLLTSAKSPFVEVRLGAYSVLQALVMRGVCIRLLLLYNDGTSSGSGTCQSSFLEWLLRKENESTSEGKQAKYQIVDALLSCNAGIIRGLIPEKALRELEVWKEKGPHYAKTIPWDMATE